MDHEFTVNLPDDVYRAARNMADRSVAERLSRAYDMLAEDSAEADVESSFAIQVEALLGE